MEASSVRTRVLIPLALLLSMAAGAGLARAAAPEIACLNAFGTSAPSAWCVTGFSDVVLAKGQPFGVTFPRGTLFVRGVASTNDPLVVRVTDEFETSLTAAVRPQSADPAQGRPAGGFSATFPAYALGAHEAEPGADVTTNAGASVLIVSVETPDEQVLAAMEVEKRAATARDIYKPVLSRLKWPPSNWCHTSLFGACGATANQDTNFMGVQLSRFPTPTGQAVVSGQVDDDPSSAWGRASETGSIMMTIRQGQRIIRGPFSVANRTSGTTAAWNVILKVEDFKPNYYPGWDKYFIDVVVRDAWGNTVTATSPGFTVYDL